MERCTPWGAILSRCVGMLTVSGEAKKLSSTEKDAVSCVATTMFGLRLVISWFLTKLYDVALINEV